MGERFDILDPFASLDLPFEAWINDGMGWLAANFRWLFQAIKIPFQYLLNWIELGLQSCPPMVFLIVGGLVAWQLGGMRVAIAFLVPLILIGLIGAWPDAMTTLSIVMTCVIACIAIGVPAGIIMSRSDRMQGVLRPVLDFMQTIPSFVYLVPVVMLFGIGKVPGAIVTMVYALPPVIRMTNFGIRQVRSDLIEAARAFGASDWQVLLKVQLPQARPTIMTGVNQNIMLALSMVVVSSMISVPGLGLLVLRGIGRLDIGLASVGGLGIVLLAIAMDRFSQSFAQTQRQRGAGRWYARGPVGLVYRLTRQPVTDRLSNAKEKKNEPD